MFATLRTGQGDGEVICVSSTNAPPQPGQSTSHFACDGCRARKLKCSGHRFGCRRCQDRGLACTYSRTSQYRRRGHGRLLASQERPSSRNVNPSPDNVMVIEQHVPSADNTNARSANQLAGSPGANEVPPESVSTVSPLSGIRSAGVAASLPQSPLQVVERFDHETPSGLLPSFEFEHLDYISADYGDLNMDLVDPDLVMIRQDSQDSAPESTSTPARSTPNTSLSPDSTTARVTAAHHQIIDTHAHQQQRGSPLPACQCIEVTLIMLEKVQTRPRTTNLSMTEQSVYTVKKLIRRCQELAKCRSCRNPFRLMTFFILLIEKMMRMVEDFAMDWEDSMHASASARELGKSATCRRLPIMFGQYQIDTMQEWCELFGLLVLQQVRHMGGLLGSLSAQAEREGWESHQSTLRSISMRIRELEVALGDISMSSV